MSKVYDNSKDVHVRATRVYPKVGDTYAYLDAAGMTTINAVTLKDLFEKGILITDGAIEYKPVQFKLAAGVATITYVKTDGTAATTAVLAVLTSKEEA